MPLKVVENVPEKSQARALWFGEQREYGICSRAREVPVPAPGSNCWALSWTFFVSSGDEAALPGMLGGRCEGRLLLRESGSSANGTQIESA